MRNVQRGEELEVLVLYVLDLVRRNAMRREEPVEVARASTIEAELYRRVREARDDARLEIHLQVDHEVELAVGELAPNVGERAPALRAIEDDDLVDGAVTTDERRRPGLKHPGDMRRVANAA